MSDLSRVEQLLRNALGEDVYNVSPMSRIEELLVQLNELIEDGGGSVSPEDIATAVSAYLDEHLTNPTNPPIDTSLSIAGAAADAKKTGDEIGDLKEELNAIDGNLTDLANGERAPLDVGEIIAGEGIYFANGNTRTGAFARTDYIDVSAYKDIVYSRRSTTATSGVGVNTVGMAFYNAEKTYISGQAQINQQSENSYVDAEITIPPNAVYARFTLYQNTTFPYSDFHINIYTELVETVREYQKQKNLGSFVNLWGIYGYLQGYAITPQDGSVYVNADYDITNFIPIEDAKIIYGKGARYYFYDENKSPIGGATGIFSNESSLADGMQYVIVPSGASYFRICTANTAPKRLFFATAFDDYLLGLINPSNGKLYCLGDSITRGMYAEIGTTSSSGPTQYGYPYWIGITNGYEVVNLGNSGSGWANVGSAETAGDPSTARNAKDVVDDNEFADADIITMAWGVNDWKGASQNVVLGDMSSVSGDGTVIGNMKYCIETLYSKKPTAQLIVLLPLNTNRQWSGMATMTLENNWAFGYAYRNNQTLEDYRNAIRACAEYYNVKVVDLEEVCPINRLNIRSVCGDGLHPTKAFHKQMGLALAPLIH